jgi:sarcosine oxidase subunit beta
MTPDGQPVIGRIEEVPGFYCACGFSGHGFKLAPAVGRIMSELVIEGSCASYDIQMFRQARFREGKLAPRAYAYGIIG